MRPEELIIEMLLIGDLYIAGLNRTDAISLERPFNRALFHVVDIVPKRGGGRFGFRPFIRKGRKQHGNLKDPVDYVG